MTQWYVKDLSQLTGVSVQTLHHYDRIGLLKPSLRMTNGYRVYTERDLLKLQQILALKFFGFELSRIQQLLKGEARALEHFAAQAQLLEEKAKSYTAASQALQSIISGTKESQSIPWETIVKTIEVYRMTKEVENSWVKEIFTPDELKQYVAFETNFKSNSTPEQKAAFEKSWAELVAEIKANLSKDPKSELGIRLGEKCMQWVNNVYGKKNAHLRTKKFEKGFAEGKGLEEVGLTPTIVAWMDQAMDAYWRKRVYDILAQVGHTPSSKVLTLWNEMLDDMYGDDPDGRKKEIPARVLEDEHVSAEAKKWVKSLM